MDLTVVMPVMNEAENLPLLLPEIEDAFSPMGWDYEVLIIDDGSNDDTWKVIQELSGRYSWLRGFRFQFNCGKAAALSQGFKMAQGRRVVTMDGDLQDNPFEVPQMLQKIDDGYDLVSGWKKVRHDPWHKTLPSRWFNLVVSIVAGLRLHDYNCGLKAYRSQVVKHIPLYGDFHRFIPVMAKWRGFRCTEMVVEHRARKHGKSKYGVSRLISGFLDLISLLFLQRFAVKPLHFFGSIGLLLVLLGTGILGFFGVQWIQTGALHLRPLMLMAAVALLMGFQFGFLGLLGEMVNARMRQETYPVADSVRPQGVHRS